jgi:hypothetical protein
MSRPLRYTKAEWLGNGQSGGSFTSGPFKVVLHTTETAGIPDYSNGATAPHLTYYARERRWVQHTSFATAARALRNESGGVQTNRDSVLQVEIVAYSAESMVDKYGGGRVKVSELTEENLADLREFLYWAHEHFGVALRWPGKRAESYGEANGSGFRMSLSQWEQYDGVCGHQHVPENDHWDPGALNWAALMKEEVDLMALSKWAVTAWNWAKSIGVMRDDSLPKATLTKEEFAVHLKRYDVAMRKHVAKVVAASAAGGATVGAVVAEVIQRLSNG